MVNVQEINRLLEKHFQIDGKTQIDPTTGVVDVRGWVSLRPTVKVTKLPVQFGKVTHGSFNCSVNTLTTLIGAPEMEDGGSFNCSNNKLTSLEGAPQKTRSFDCSDNSLTSLVGAPESLDYLGCDRNPLQSLEGFPQVIEVRLDMSYRPDLPLLRTLVAKHSGIHLYARQTSLIQAAEQVEAILNKYAGQGKPGAIKCAVELVKAGYKENARW